MRGGSIEPPASLGCRPFVGRPPDPVVAALESTVRYLAADLGEQGIRVNAISAGPLKTASARGIPGFSAMQQQAIDKSPLGEQYDVKHVAGTAVFLASDLAPSITGDVILVDGGYHAMGV